MDSQSQQYAGRLIAVIEGCLSSTKTDREEREEWPDVEAVGASASIEEIVDEREEYEEF
jgi:hypothetical protein